MAFNSAMPSSTATGARPWTAVLPVRSFTEGKTRLRVPRVETRSLIRAFAQDVAAACTTCPQIERTVIVSPDPDVLAAARDYGCDTYVQESAAGINEAIEAVRQQIAGPLVAILGDVPCLTDSILSMVLSEASEHAVSFVADTSGVGSTMWCARKAPDAHPHFGHHSRAEHRSHGAVELGVGSSSSQWARARRDVDTDIDLWDATRLGLGPATSRLVGDDDGRA